MYGIEWYNIFDNMYVYVINVVIILNFKNVLKGYWLFLKNIFKYIYNFFLIFVFILGEIIIFLGNLGVRWGCIFNFDIVLVLLWYDLLWELS